MVTTDMIIQAKENLHQLIYSQWITEQFLSSKWLATTGLIAFSYLLFFYFVDKKRIIEILLYGSLISVIYTIYDMFGSQFVFWTFVQREFPIMPSIFPDNLTYVPLYAMLVYQYTHTWKSFAIWNTVWAGALAFGVFPLGIALNIVQFHIPGGIFYHFVFFCFAGVSMRAIMGRLLIMEARAGNSSAITTLNYLVGQPAMKMTNDEDKNKLE